MTITRTEYNTAARIVSEIGDPLRQAIVYRAFCNLFQTQPNFNAAKFESACKIIDPMYRRHYETELAADPRLSTKPPAKTTICSGCDNPKSQCNCSLPCKGRITGTLDNLKHNANQSGKPPHKISVGTVRRNGIIPTFAQIERDRIKFNK